jgi:hypothetical protein
MKTNKTKNTMAARTTKRRRGMNQQTRHRALEKLPHKKQGRPKLYQWEHHEWTQRNAVAPARRTQNGR